MYLARFSPLHLCVLWYFFPEYGAMYTLEAAVVVWFGTIGVPDIKIVVTSKHVKDFLNSFIGIFLLVDHS